MKALRKVFEQLRQLYYLPGQVYRNFETFCIAALSAIRDLTAAIHSHNERVSELHSEIKQIAVGYLHRAKRQ